MVKLRDLASLVGVHPSTVSRVLSGDPRARLSPATRQRIIELAAATGYRPNRLARSLKFQRTHIIGMLVPDIANPFYSVMFRAVEDAAEMAGYNVILCNTDESELRFDQHVRMLEGHVDGLLLATAQRNDPGIESLNERQMPCVLVNRRRDDPGDCWVVADGEKGSWLAVDHLVALGHRRIAYIHGPPGLLSTSLRVASFRRALTHHGIFADDRLIVRGGVSEDSGTRAMAGLLELGPNDRPTALHAANDLVAMGAISAARSAGLRIPADLSIVGYNDIELAGRLEPGLTTIQISAYQMGLRAAQILIGWLDSGSRPNPESAHVVLPVRLIVRGSTAAAKPSGERDGARS